MQFKNFIVNDLSVILVENYTTNCFFLDSLIIKCFRKINICLIIFVKLHLKWQIVYYVIYESALIKRQVILGTFFTLLLKLTSERERIMNIWAALCKQTDTFN